jgi:ABC-2 type transport system permease protein
MPIHDVGYRKWSGPLTNKLTRWWTITEAGFQMTFKSTWFRRLMIASWIPVLVFGYSVFFLEKLMEAPASEAMQRLDLDAGGFSLPAESAAAESLANEAERIKRAAIASQFEKNLPFAPNSSLLASSANVDDERLFRHQMWSFILAMFLRYPQLVMTLLLVGLVVPPLISRDVRSRAFLLYYSRPITRMEYLLGKLCIPATILSMITMVPALVLYAFSVSMSPDLRVIADTWDLPIRVILASLCCIIPVSLISLLFSSMTQESRFASFGWFAVWGLGAVIWFMIYAPNQFAQVETVTTDPRIGPSSTQIVIDGGNEVQFKPYESNWSLVSLYSTIGRVQAWIFGLETRFQSVFPSIIMLATVSVVSAIWLYRRVSAPVRI